MTPPWATTKGPPLSPFEKNKNKSVLLLR
jgi:hypothetical protein